MKRKIKRWLTLAVVLTGIMVSTTTVFAYTDGTGATETAQRETAQATAAEAPGAVPEETADETGVVQSGAVLEENASQDKDKEVADKPAGTAGGSFSVPGNGQLVDDMPDDGTKEFLTVRTKNGNTFYMVLDRSSGMENAYMLSMIDEADLAEFIEDAEAAEVEIPQVAIPETTPAVTEAVDIQPEKESSNKGALLIIGVLSAAAIGGLYYAKMVKPKKAEDGAEEEDLEFYDDGAYINEDEEDA